MNNKIIFLIVCATFWAACSESGTDAKPFDASVVCPENARGTFVDERDGQVYKYTTIGDQVWMAQNLNYASEYSTTNDSLKDCAECGLWYGLSKGASNGIDLIDTVCPVGWKVPTEEEWEKLFSSVGGRSKAMKILLSENWIGKFEGQTNECGLDVITSSRVIIGDYAGFSKGHAFFWTHTETRPTYMKIVHFDENPIRIRYEEGWTNGYYSIRCIKD